MNVNELPDIPKRLAQQSKPRIPDSGSPALAWGTLWSAFRADRMYEYTWFEKPGKNNDKKSKAIRKATSLYAPTVPPDSFLQQKSPKPYADATLPVAE